MDPKEDEEISIDFSKIKNFFKRYKKEDKKTSDAEVKEGKKAEEDSLKQEKNKDEEITIDFSKIKSFFKSDKREDLKTDHASKTDEKKDDEEIQFSFDLGKIKKFFKASDKEPTVSDEEITVDWSKIVSFFKKYGIVFIALIPIILSIYVRMQAGFLLFTDDWAENSVISLMRSDISPLVNYNYPNLPDSQKNAIIDNELSNALKSGTYTFKTGQYQGQTFNIKQQVQQTSNYFKSFFQDENGKRYMPDIDPYYWFRYAENIIEHGHPGDILKDGRPFDNLQLAPLGRFVFPDMFPAYAMTYFYRFLHFFMPNLKLIYSIVYLPIIISALCVLLVFLIGRKIAGNVGGFFAGLMMAVNAAFLTRSLHPDNDIWVIFFPLLITWLFIMIIDTKNTFKIVILTVLAGFFTGLFTIAWIGGWWYIFYFLLTTIGLTFAYLVLIKTTELKKFINLFISDTDIRNIILLGVIYLLATAIFTSLFSGWNFFKGSFLAPFKFPSIKAPTSASLWPNVLTTVAELNEGSMGGIVNSIGGPFLFYISLIGLVLSITRKEGLKKFDFIYILISALFYGILFIKPGNSPAIYQSVTIFTLSTLVMLPILTRIFIVIFKKDSSYDFKLSILLSLWVVSTIFASIKGIRFTLLLSPAFSVAFGVALGKLYIYLSKWLTKELKIHKVISSSIFFILLTSIYIIPNGGIVKGATNIARSDIPIVNDAWYSALIAINKSSSEDAIITSWWDFGHHFKALANRRVTFDGTTQTSPAAHWVGKLLMTDNEIQAIGILRMLDCGHNNAYDTLLKINNDAHKSLKILNEIALMSKEKARKKLIGYGLTAQQSEEVLSNTHCNPPEAYFIASEDMIGKSGVWSHFGSWNFERADIWQNARKMSPEEAVAYMVKKFNYTKERAENVYFEIQSITSDSEANAWVAPWPGYVGTITCSKNDKGIYTCQRITIGKDNAGRDVFAVFQVNLSNFDIFGFVQGVEGNIVRPSAAAFTTEDNVIKKEFNATTIGLGMTIIPKSENELQVVLSSKELTGSIFTRMFYMQGHGLKYFKLFNHQRGLTGTNIYTYKVDWEGKNTTIVNEYVDYLKKPVKKETIKEDVQSATNQTSDKEIKNKSTSENANIIK